MGPVEGFLRHDEVRDDGAESSAKVGACREEGVVGACDIDRPNVGECAFDEHEL